MKKKVVILGSTGSIGTQTLDVITHQGDIEVLGLTANSQIDLLEKQIEREQKWEKGNKKKAIKYIMILNN